MGDVTETTVALSDSHKQDLLSRHCAQKRFNGAGVGSRLCVDNLGEHYDEASLQHQLADLLPDVERIHFATVHVDDDVVPLGWCCIHFRSPDAAVEGIKILDRTYLELYSDSSILRPLLAHFPDRSQDEERGIDAFPMALRMGQSNTVDGEGREFLRLQKMLSVVKARLLEETKSTLRPLLKPLLRVQGASFRAPAAAEETVLSKVLCLHDVPVRVTDASLRRFFWSYDPDVRVSRVSSAVTGEKTSRVAVAFSSRQKADIAAQDVAKHMVLSDGFQPISGSLMKRRCVESFGFAFDAALLESGYVQCGISTALVVIEDGEIAGERTTLALKLRSALERLQYLRSDYHRTRRKQYDALRKHIASEVKKTYEKFAKVNRNVQAAERLL